MVELSDEELDGVVGGTNPGGGNGTATVSATLGLGPVSIGGSVNLQTGQTYFTGGFSPSLSFGGNVSLNAVLPFSGHTADDVITGPGYGGEAYFGGGGGISVNSSGVIVSGGFGLSIGGGMTLTAPTGPNTTSQTVEVPVYDAMGNATGFTTTVANPMYNPADEAAMLQGQANQAGANVSSIQNLQQMANTPTYDGSAQFPQPSAAPSQDGAPAPSGTPSDSGAPQAGGASGSDPNNGGATAAAGGGSGPGTQDQSNVPIDNTNGDFGNQTGGTNSGAGGSGQNDNTYGDFGDNGGGGGGGGGGDGGDGGG